MQRKAQHQHNEDSKGIGGEGWGGANAEPQTQSKGIDPTTGRPNGTKPD